MSTSPHLGHFIWHDLMTRDPGAAKAFYVPLFGWELTTHDMGGPVPYEMIEVGGRGLGGILPLQPGMQGPSHWLSYVDVADLDACVARAEKLGGRILAPAREIPHVGRFAVVQDPQGAVFSPFQHAAGTPQELLEQPLPSGPGAFCWHELLTNDPPGSVEFYRGLLGWTHREQPMGALGTYHLFFRGEEMAAGMMAMPGDAGSPPNWLPYIFVADVDAAARKTGELGGEICVPPTDIPGVGRFSVAADPAGAFFAHFTA